LIELIVVLGTLTFLTLMLSAAWAGEREDARVLQCWNNLRQLHGGWQAYSDENGGSLMPLAGTDAPNAPQWCPGRMDAPSESTNVTYIHQGLMWPNVKSVSAYKCPADPKLTGGTPTVRSYSMNIWMNPRAPAHQQGLSGPALVFRKQSDIIAAMSPSKCWVLIDESPNTINDSMFSISGNPRSGPNTNTWIDVPAAHHGLAGSLVFADGRVELKRWRDRKIPTNGLFQSADADQDPPYADLRWLQERSTVAP
jgi:hypothetical protein